MSNCRAVGRSKRELRLQVELLEVRQVPAVLISEIMYNPASNEGPPPNRVEWVELYNNGFAAVSLQSVHLTDVTEGGRTGRSANFTVTIPARSAVVVFPDTISLSQFREAWAQTWPEFRLAGGEGTALCSISACETRPSAAMASICNFKVPPVWCWMK